MTADEIGKLPTPKVDGLQRRACDVAESLRFNDKYTDEVTQDHLQEAYDYARKQEQAIAALMEALQDSMNAVSYADEDDEVGCYHCCGNVSYKGHSKDCAKTATLAAVRKHLGERE